MSTTKMNEIEAACKAYSEARTKLADQVGELQAGIEALKRQHLPRVRRAVQRAAEMQNALHELVADSKVLFVKPRSVVLHGIKVGFEKGKGAIEFDDADQVVALIEKKLPELAEALIQVTKKPLKTALKNLTVRELKLIGCNVEETDDQVVVRAVDREVDKLVNALLKGAVEEAATETA